MRVEGGRNRCSHLFSYLPFFPPPSSKKKKKHQGRCEGCEYRVDGIFIWNDASWDIQGIYPESTVEGVGESFSLTFFPAFPPPPFFFSLSFFVLFVFFSPRPKGPAFTLFHPSLPKNKKRKSGSYRDPAVVSMIEAHNARAMAGGPFEVLSVAVPPSGTAPYADGNVNVKPQPALSSSSSRPQVSTASAAVGGGP